MKPHFFVTGTDTEVGKTVVSCGLMAAAQKRGDTLALKPVAAGCDDNGQNEDALALMAAMSLSLPYETVNPVALAKPIAPHIAAVGEGVQLTADSLVQHCRQVLGAEDAFAVVEGAGGWRVPLNDRETLADLARLLDLRVILVVGMRLGCINHALLSAEAVANDGLQLAGWVANHLSPSMAVRSENVSYLQSALPAPLLGEVPYLPSAAPEQVGQYIDIERLF